jgi:hypothetical protein
MTMGSYEFWEGDSLEAEAAEAARNATWLEPVIIEKVMRADHDAGGGNVYHRTAFLGRSDQFEIVVVEPRLGTWWAIIGAPSPCGEGETRLFPFIGGMVTFGPVGIGESAASATQHLQAAWVESWSNAIMHSRWDNATDPVGVAIGGKLVELLAQAARDATKAHRARRRWWQFWRPKPPYEGDDE